MSVARLARDVLWQPWLLRHQIGHVLPRVQAEVAREMQPHARRVFERRKLKRGEQPRCMMAVGCVWPRRVDLDEDLEGCGWKCLTLRAGLVIGVVTLYWPKAPHRSPRLFSGAAGERLKLTAEQAHVLADAIADIGRSDCADMVRHLADSSMSPTVVR